MIDLMALQHAAEHRTVGIPGGFALGGVDDKEGFSLRMLEIDPGQFLNNSLSFLSNCRHARHSMGQTRWGQYSPAMLDVDIFLAYVDGLVGQKAEKVVTFCKSVE